MEKLKITIYKHNESQPDTTITIPFAAHQIAEKIISWMTTSTLESCGIDPSRFFEIAKEHEIVGPLLKVERHKKGQIIIVSAE